MVIVQEVKLDGFETYWYGVSDSACVYVTGSQGEFAEGQIDALEYKSNKRLSAEDAAALRDAPTQKVEDTAGGAEAIDKLLAINNYSLNRA